MLHVKRRNVFTQEYVAENKDDKDKTLIIEHPFRQGWKLLEPEKPLETTDTLYRFKTTVPAGKSASTTVKEELVNYETVEILPMDIGTMDFYAKTGEISKGVRDALAKAITLKQQLEQLRRDAQAQQTQIAQITQEQVRIRENVKVAPSSQVTPMKSSCLLNLVVSSRGSYVEETKMTFGLSGWMALSPV